jgi:hypothetical protein
MEPRRQIISHIPQRGMSAEEWGLVTQTELLKMWMNALSAADREKLELARDEQGLLVLDRIPARLFVKLDEIILQQAETLGWRIELSELIRFRKSEWDKDPDGPEKHLRLGKANARSARIMQRRELPPIDDPDQWLVKQETVQELRLVLQRMRATFALSRRAPTRDEVRTLFSGIITDSPQTSPHLATNLDRWLKFFEENPDLLRPVALGDRAKPAALYDEFLSWSTGWEPESLRQAISNLKTKL